MCRSECTFWVFRICKTLLSMSHHVKTDQYPVTKLVHHWVERAWNIHSANHQRAATKWGSYTISWYKPVRLHSPNTSWPFHICFIWVLETSIYDKRILQRNVPSDTWNVCPVCTQKWTFAKLSTLTQRWNFSIIDFEQFCDKIFVINY